LLWAASSAHAKATMTAITTATGTKMDGTIAVIAMSIATTKEPLCSIQSFSQRP
jgi:hypothetical protein